MSEDSAATPNLDDLVRIEKICTDFEQSWQEGGSPYAEDVASAHPDVSRSLLLQELVPLEAEQRQKRALQLVALERDYQLRHLQRDLQERFPDQAPLIEELFTEMESREQSPPPEPLDLEDHSESMANTGPWAKGPGGTTLPTLSSDQEIIPPLPPDYTLVKPLGQGGMGVVLLVYNKILDRHEAWKLIRFRFQSKEQEELQQKRFEQEIKACAGLSHSNIAKVYGCGTVEQMPYFSMEHIEGSSLEKLLKEKGAIPVRRAVRMMERIADATHHAHSRGMIHRDLKPGNIQLTHELHPFVVDFGLAVYTTPDETGEHWHGKGVEGTPLYMAPEQTHSEAHLTNKVDIYSLGATLYEMVSGKPPFTASTMDELLRKHREEKPIPPSRHNRKVSKHLDAIILKCLEKAPEDRYESAAHLRDDLRRFQKHEPITGCRVRLRDRVWLWIRRNPLIALLLLILVGMATGAGITIYQKQNRLETSLVNETASRKKAQQNETRANQEEKRAVDARKEVEKLLVRSFEQQGNRFQLEGSLIGLLYFEKALSHSSDGSGAASLRARTALYQAPHLQQLLVHSHVLSSAELSPDDQWLLTACEDGKARVFHAASGDLKHVLPHRGPVTRAIFHPNGKLIATACEDRTARVWDAQTGKPVTEPLRLGQPIRAIAFSPNGRLLAAGGGMPFQSGQMVDGPMIPHQMRIPAGQQRLPGGGFIPRWQTITVMRRGPQIWRPARGRAVTWEIPSGKVLGRMGMPGWINHLAFSEDSTKVAIANGVISGSGMALVHEAQTGKRLTEYLKHVGNVLTSQFGKNGSRLLTSSGRHMGSVGEGRLWDITNDKGAILARFPHPGQVVHAELSPQGDQILTAGRDRTVRLWALPKEDDPEGLTVPMRLVSLESALTAAAFSPNGQHFLTVTKDHRVRVWNAFTGEATTPYLKHGAPVMSARFNSAGTKVVTSCWDGSARIWDMTKQSQKQILYGSNSERRGALTFLEPTGDGSHLILGEGGVTVTRHVVGSRAFSEDATETRSIKVLTLDGELKASLPHRGEESWPIISPNGNEVVVVQSEKGEGKKPAKQFARIWGIKENATLASLPLQGPLRWLGYVEDGRCLAITGARDGSLEIYEARTGQPVHRGIRHNLQWLTSLMAMSGPLEARLPALSLSLKEKPLIKAASLSPNGRWLFTAGAHHSGAIWDLKNNGQLSSVLNYRGSLTKTVWSASGEKLAVVSRHHQGWGYGDGGEAILWNAQEQKQIGKRIVHLAQIRCARFDPGGEIFITTSTDHTARLWSAQNGESLCAPLRHQGPVMSAGFSQDSTLVATASRDGTARVWSTENGEAITSHLRHGMAVVGLSFSANGDSLMTASTQLEPGSRVTEAGLVRRWGITSADVDLSHLKVKAELLSGHRLDRTGAIVPLSPGELKQRWRKLH